MLRKVLSKLTVALMLAIVVLERCKKAIDLVIKLLERIMAKNTKNE